MSWLHTLSPLAPIALVLAGCAAPELLDPGPEPTTVTVVGPANQAAALAGVRSSFQARSGVAADFRSTAGRPSLPSRGDELAATDSPPTGRQWRRATRRCPGTLVGAPAWANAVAVVYNASLDSPLRLSLGTLAAVLEGRVTRWDDPLLQLDNPDLNLPDAEVRLVRDQAASGVDRAVREATGASKIRPARTIDVPDALRAVDTVAHTEGTLALVESRLAGELQTAALPAAGDWLQPRSGVAGQEQWADVPWSDDRGPLPRPDLTLGTAYPLVTVSYLVACRVDPATSPAVELLEFTLSDAGQRALADASGSTPLPETVAANWRHRAGLRTLHP